jgi:hypothetical protein
MHQLLIGMYPEQGMRSDVVGITKLYAAKKQLSNAHRALRM